MRISQMLSTAAVAAILATTVTLYLTSTTAAATPTPDDESSKVEERVRKDATRATDEDKVLIVVYPVDNIEHWEESLPKGAPGIDNRYKLDDNRELMLLTHFPYLASKSERINLVNFQREYHRQLDKGSVLVWTDGTRAYFTNDRVKINKNARVSREE